MFDRHTFAYLGLAGLELAACVSYAIESAPIHAATALAAAALHAALCRWRRRSVGRRRTVFRWRRV